MEGIEDARITKFNFHQWQIVDVSCFLFSFQSIILSVIEYDARMRDPERNQATIKVLLILLSLTTGVLSKLILIIYK